MKTWHVFLFVMFLVILGCGGGGGGTSTPSQVNVVGQILWIETGAGTAPASTVRIGDQSTTTDVTDGFFSLDVPTGSTSLTVTYAGSGSPIVRTFLFSALTADADLGELYIGPSEVTVNGTLVDSTNSSPVSGATVSLGGRSATSTSNGQFSIPGVAYSTDSQAVFFGLQGTASATGYFQAFFSPSTAASGGVVQIGTVTLTPEGTTTPPDLPFNVSGTILPLGAGGGATVLAKVGATTVRTVSSDVSGRYTMWLPAGVYTIEASKGGASGTATATVNNVSQPITVNVTLN